METKATVYLDLSNDQKMFLLLNVHEHLTAFNLAQCGGDLVALTAQELSVVSPKTGRAAAAEQQSMEVFKLRIELTRANELANTQFGVRLNRILSGGSVTIKIK